MKFTKLGVFILRTLSNGIIASLIVVFIIDQIFDNSYVSLIYLIMTAAVIIISLFYSKGLPRFFGIVMVIVSIVILSYETQTYDVWMNGITKNVPLICLIVIVPILGIPIGLGNYHQQIADFTARFQKKPHLLYLFITGLFTIIGPITNMGALYIVHAMLDKLKLPTAFLGRVYLRGFTSVHTWSPYFASVFLVVYSLNIPISQFLPYGFILSFFQICIAYLLFRYVEMKQIEINLMEQPVHHNMRKLYELFAVILLLTSFIFLFEPLIDLNASVLISMIVLLFALLWSTYLKFLKQFFKEVNTYRKEIFPDKANEINLLLTAGFFGVVLAKTPISHYLQNIWGSLAEISILLLIFSTIALIAVLSFVGVHQIVTISTLIATVSYEELGIHVIVMAMMLLSSWAVSTTISPITPVITIISSILKENAFKIILRWNLLYAIIIAIIHTIVIYLIHLLWLS